MRAVAPPALGAWWPLEQAVTQLPWIDLPRTDPIPHRSEDILARPGLIPLENNELLSLFLAVRSVRVKVCRATFLTLPIRLFLICFV